MAVVAFVPDDFRESYPQFVAMSDARLTGFFTIAATLVDNTDTAIVPYDPSNGVYKRKIVLDALTCHLATLAKWQDDGQQGATQSASEGSVSASFAIPQFGSQQVAMQWYNQTTCGRTALMLLRPYMLGGRYYGIKHIHPFG